MHCLLSSNYFINKKEHPMKNVLNKKVAFFVFILAIMPAFLQAQSLNKAYDGVKAIDISTVTGDITIKKGNTKTIKVEGKWDESQVAVRVRHSGEYLTIKEKSKRNNTDSDASYWVLIVPDGLNIETNSGTGSVEISGIEADLDANSGTGDIEVANMSGRFNINSGTGSVEVKNAEGKFDMNSGTGDVIVANSRGKFEANSGTGDVQFKMVDPTGYTKLSSGTGDVEFMVGTQIKADLSLSSGTGDAVLDFQGNKIEGDFEMNCGRRSGEIVAPFKFDSVRRTGDNRNGGVEKIVRIGNSDYELEISTGTGTAEVKS